MYKHEQRAKNYPGVLLEEVDCHLKLPDEDIGSSTELMEGIDQLSKRHRDDDACDRESNLYPQKKRPSLKE